MKKFLLILMLAFLALPISAFEYYDLNYNITSEDDRTCEVVGINTKYYSSIVIPETVVYNSKIYTVTSIGVYAFNRCYNLTGVTIPNSVTSIGYRAFYYCYNLESVEIPNSVTSIGEEAFYGCSFMTSVKIGNSVTSIGIGAFYNCDRLTKVEISDLEAWCNIDFYDIDSNPLYYANHLYLNGEEVKDLIIPNSVTEIGNYAFSGCSGLTSVEIPNSVTSIGIDAFYNCGRLTKVEISDLEAWCNIWFTSAYSTPLYFANHLYLNGEEITDLIIPNSVTEIGNYAFSGCSGLTSVEIGDSVTSIGYRAFYYCYNLESVEIPNSVTEIGSSAFWGCSGLTGDLIIPNSVTSIGEQAFYYCSGFTNLEIGNSVTEIGVQAFEGCSGLISVEIPNSVTSIGSSAFRGCPIETLKIDCFEVGSWFQGNTTLQSLIIGNSVKEVNSSAFESCNLEYIQLENDTPPSFYSAFASYSSQATLEIPQNSIFVYLMSDWRNFLNIRSNGEEIARFVQNDGVFEYQFLENEGKAILTGCINDDMSVASIPDRVVGNYGDEEKFYLVNAIANDAFRENSNLSQLKLPANLEAIGVSAFYGCSSLTKVEIPNSVTEIGRNAFYNCSGLTKVEISDLEAWCNIRFTDFYSNPLYYANHLYLNGEELIDLIIPNSVTSIGDYAFYNCSGLRSVEIPNSVTEIGSSAFWGCSGLESVTIPNSVTEIGWYAFMYCGGLTSVEIGDSVTEIGAAAFLGCSGLTSVEIPNSVTEIGVQAFEGCSGLTSVEIPNSVTTIGSGAFRGCSGLTSVTIPNSVTEIGNQAFRYVQFDSFKFNDGPALLRFNGENNISTKSLYLGRNFSGNLSSTDLESLEVGGFVTNLPNNFNNPTLRSVIINPGAEVVIEDNAFSGCNNLANLILPEDIAEIGANAFSGTALKNITVPGGVIGDSAFANCNLDNIILGANVESIGENAFDGSNAIKNVYATPTTPPAAQNNTFSYYEAQLWVPEEAIDTYYNFTRCWYRFNGKPLVCPENIVVTGPEKINGKPGETFQLSATISPSNVTLDRVLWRSTNPAVATVDNNGLVTLHNFQVSEESVVRIAEEGFCQIIATTLYEESPVAVVNIEVSSGGTTSIEYINSEDLVSAPSDAFNQNDVYTLQGVCVKRQASQGDIEALTPGIYIIGGKKVIVK